MHIKQTNKRQTSVFEHLYSATQRFRCASDQSH